MMLWTFLPQKLIMKLVPCRVEMSGANSQYTFGKAWFRQGGQVRNTGDVLTMSNCLLEIKTSYDSRRKAQHSSGFCEGLESSEREQA